MRLGPILGSSDLTEWEAKRDLAVAAQAVYLPCLCQWPVWENAMGESWRKADTSGVNDWDFGWPRIQLLPHRTWFDDSLAGQQVMHELVCLTDLEMEFDETDEDMVRQKSKA